MRNKLLIILTVLGLMSPALIQPSVAFACPSGSRGQVLQGIGETGSSGCQSNGIDNVVGDVVQLLSIFVGVLAVIVIIVSGFKYITSGGDANKVGNAKSTLLYALIGVIIAALAQFLVHFVLNRADVAASGTTCTSDSSISASDPACKSK